MISSRTKKILICLLFILWDWVAQSTDGSTQDHESTVEMNQPQALEYIKTKLQNARPNLEDLPGAVSREYDLLHPYYVKYCATTRYHPKAGRIGGSVGHAVFYLKGACKDRDGPASQLKLCEEQADYKDPNLGVGVSVNRGLKNANFFAVPGLTLFLAGDMDFKKTFDESVRQSMIQEALRGGVLDNIEFHDFAFELRGKKMDRDSYVVNEIFGTDFAINMARNLYCINVPVTRPMMGEVVNSLNQLNARYRQSASGYQWSGIFDNCAHTINNAFANFGLLRKKGVNLGFFRQLFNLAVPANTFLSLHEQASLEDIDVDKYYQDPLKREVFRKYKWIAQQDGALAEFIPTYNKNAVYDPDDTLFIQPHLLENRYRTLKSAVTDPRYSYQGKGYEGFILNLIYFDEKYTRALDVVRARKTSQPYSDAVKSGDASKIRSLQIEIRSKEIEQMTTTKLSKNWKRLAEDLAALNVDLSRRREARDYFTFVDEFEDFLVSQIHRVESTVVQFYKLGQRAKAKAVRPLPG